jgi:hypothetical protein
MNVFGDEWDALDDWSAAAASRSGSSPRAASSERASTSSARQLSRFHFHHGSEELLIVLRGRPTLRTPEGERAARRG